MILGAAMRNRHQNAVELSALSFSYSGNRQNGRVLHDISLTIRTGEFVCVIGHSGCGKTTLLKILAGLLPVQSGKALLSDTPVTGPGADRAVVFQHYSLFPWMTVLQNVVFGIRQACKKRKRAEMRAIAEAYLRKVDMWADKDKYPYQLSGGMQQRVALARALAMDADLLLLDEPFGALDTKKRRELQQLLEELWMRAPTPKTVLFVTHDIEEAILLADRILFMQPGRFNADLPVCHARPRSGNTNLNPAAYADLKHTLQNLFYLCPERTADEARN